MVVWVLNFAYLSIGNEQVCIFAREEFLNLFSFQETFLSSFTFILEWLLILKSFQKFGETNQTLFSPGFFWSSQRGGGGGGIPRPFHNFQNI